jgi:putative spermidine/putrescine transport system substrate-binding protein
MPGRVVRRRLLAVALGMSALGASSLWVRRSRAQPARRQVIVSGWGGAMQRAMRTAYFAPFTRATGIEVVEQTYGGQGLARVKAQLRAGKPQVDLLDSAPFWALIGSQQNLLAPLEIPDVSPADFTPGAIGKYGFGYATVSWGIAHSTLVPRAPASWRDFWNTRDFRGRRALFGPFVARHPEYALMAEGVPPAGVYPLDDAKIDRAFDRLAALKDAVAVWYQTGAQFEQMLVGRQIDMGEFFSGRSFFLQDRHVPVSFVWNEAIMNTMLFVLARNAPNYDNAMQFLSFVARPETQAAFAKAIYYGPTNMRALELIKDRRTLERLPTHAPNLAKQLVLDTEWWGHNIDRLSARWSQLISG